MIKVESSNIKEVDYNGKDMIILFHNGRKYRYYDVPYTVFTEFLDCKSKGSFFHRRIKSHKCDRID